MMITLSAEQEEEANRRGRRIKMDGKSTQHGRDLRKHEKLLSQTEIHGDKNWGREFIEKNFY